MACTRTLPRAAATLVAALALPVPPAAQNPWQHRPLADINQVAAGSVNLGSGPRWLTTSVGPIPRLFFSAFTETTGRELWSTLGTPATTGRVADWVLGPTGSDPEGFVEMPNGSLVGVMTHPQKGRELHRIKVSATISVELIDDSLPGPGYCDYSQPALAGGRAYYLAGHVTAGRYLVRLLSTDGSDVREEARIGDGVREPFQMVAAGGRLYTGQASMAHGYELGVYDPTAKTFTVHDATPGPLSSQYGFLQPFGNDLLAGGHVAGVTALLHSSGGPPKTLRQFKTDTEITGGVVAGSLCYFSADSGNGQEPHVSDGTATGTKEIQDVMPGAASSSPYHWTVVSGRVYGSCLFPQEGRELAVFTPSSASVAFDINPGPLGSDPSALVGTPAGLYLGAADATARHVWRVTTTLTPCSNLPSAAGADNPATATALGDACVFSWTTSGSNDEPYVTAGTPPVTTPLGDLNGQQTLTLPSDAEGFVYSQGKTLFFADDGVHGGEIWETVGDTQSTQRRTDHNPGPASSQVKHMLALDQGVFCIAGSPAAGEEPCLFDPATGKLDALRDIVPGAAGSAPANAAGPFGLSTSSRPQVFFQATATFGTGPWRSDGTPAGTIPLRTAGDLVVKGFTQLGDRVIFSGDDAQHGDELWISDGTAAGTRLVLDIADGVVSSAPKFFAVMGDVAYFTAWDRTARNELWRTDGTVAGTFRVKDIHPSSDSFPSYQTVVRTMAGPRLFFAARDPQHGTELWMSDGTESGTTLVADLVPGREGSKPEELIAVGSRVFFTAQVLPSVRLLMRSDGSFTFTYGQAIDPAMLRVVGERILFVANDGRGDRELWEANLLFARLQTDIRRGTLSGGIREIRVAGGGVYVTADNGVTGREPYVLPRIDAVAERVGTGCGHALPLLEATPPVIGGKVTLRGLRAPAGHVGLVCLSGEATGSGLPLPGGCLTKVDLGSLLIVGQFATTTPEWTLELPVPDDSRLTTSKLMAWVLYVPLEGGDFTATNGVLLAPGE